MKIDNTQTSLDFLSLSKKIEINNNKFFNLLEREKQKEIGQFATPEYLADFMARKLVSNINIGEKKELKILDPGAGTGVHGIAVIKKLFKKNRYLKLHLITYENDSQALKFLQNNLSILKQWTLQNNLYFKYEIRNWDYVLENRVLADNLINSEKYDLIISNPPYKKLKKDSLEAKSFPSIVYGAPNEYTFFLTKSILELSNDGACIYITPRSWMSGAYFERFRHFLLKTSNILEIYSFDDRNNRFGSTKVLQELVVFVLNKKKNNIIKYLSFNNIKNINEKKPIYIKKERAIVGKEQRVLTLRNENDIKILNKLEKLNSTFIQSGLKMRTGLTVTYRNKNMLLKSYQENTYPIFYPSNIKHQQIELAKQNYQFIKSDKPSLLQKNHDYIFVKRFSSKEQKRRVQCGYYDCRKYEMYKFISTDNKLNFVTCLDKEVLRGAFIFLSSNFFDCYYRLLGGNTQVNSNEINSMSFPTTEELRKIGKNLNVNYLDNLTQNMIEKIVNKFWEEKNLND